MNPQPGETWRHWRGTDVVIWGMDFIDCQVPEGCGVYFGKRGKAIALCDIPKSSDLVIYERDGKYKARTLANFLGSIQSGGNTFKRFQRCSNQP